jgi:hypothetical protein
VLLR